MFGNQPAQTPAFGAPAGGGLTEIQRSCQDIHQRLQAMSNAHAKNFVAFSFTVAENQQQLQMAHNAPFDPNFHRDLEKFEQAKQTNPDPANCYAEPLFGLKALEERAIKQKDGMEKEAKMLAELENGLQNLKNHVQTDSMTKLEECKKRHVKLQGMLVSVMAQVEGVALQQGQTRRDYSKEQALDANYSDLQNRLMGPSQFQSRVSELSFVLRALLQRLEGNGPRPGTSFDGENFDTQSALGVLNEQGEFLRILREELRNNQADVTQMEAVLQKTSGPRPNIGTGL